MHDTLADAGGAAPAVVAAPAPVAALVVVPCLNEARHIAGILRQLAAAAERLDLHVVVADGGSTDGTTGIVRAIAGAAPRITLIRNRKRVQSAALNLAADRFGAETAYLIRIDAHCRYPDDYCDTLIAEAAATGADSIVVSMIAEGTEPVQEAIATAQNARLGNGGSAHRNVPEGRFVDHGHHALMRMAAFRAVGGYDEAFRWNEDAELDVRLARAGYRIWLTARTVVTYHPRRTFGALFRQYFGYGQGRAQTLLKHRLRPARRQAAVAAVGPAVGLAILAAGQGLLAAPAALWVLGCVGGGVAIAARARRPRLALSSVSAMTMHLAWSLGFWRKVASPEGVAMLRGAR